jgi:hypothetical protein
MQVKTPVRLTDWADAPVAPKAATIAIAIEMRLIRKILLV